MGQHHLFAGVRGDAAAVGQDRRPVRAAPAVRGGRDAVWPGIGAGRGVVVDWDAGRHAGAARRRRGHPQPQHALDCDHDFQRQRARDRLRHLGRDGGRGRGVRPAAGRLGDRSRLVALGVLHQHPGGGRGLRRIAVGDPGVTRSGHEALLRPARHDPGRVRAGRAGVRHHRRTGVWLVEAGRGLFRAGLGVAVAESLVGPGRDRGGAAAAGDLHLV